MQPSTNWYDRARSITPLASQTRSKGPAAYGGEPMYATYGDGSRIVAMRDGYRHEMIDWVCGLGAISLGYRYGHVQQAIAAQLDQGISYSLPHYLEAEVGERLREMIPCMKPDGMVRFVKTGSEACEAAVRIARKATGRDLVLTVRTGYHGWHSWFQAVNPEHPGVPTGYRDSIRPIVYNDQLSAKSNFLYHGDKIAAVILEPTLFTPPAAFFLEKLRWLCSHHGAVLIFDEMVTGFRLARAGGQEKFGVVPDLATFGKGMANGMPLACVCGKRALMEHADVVSGTFGGEALSLAAAKAVLEVYGESRVCEHMESVGQYLNNLLQEAAASAGLPVRFDGWPQVCRMVWTDDDYTQPSEVVNHATGLFTQEMAKRGILWHPRIRYVSYAHTGQDVEVTVREAKEVFPIVAKAWDSRDFSALKAAPERPFARKG